MNEKPSKEFRKYLIVPTEMYRKMHSGIINESRLSDFERKMLEILRDKNLSTTQRLKFYQQLLFARSKKPEPEVKKKVTTREIGIQSDNLNGESFEFANAAVGDELRRFSTPLKAFKNPQVDDVFITPETNFGPPNQEEYFERLPSSPSATPVRKIIPPFRRLKKISYQESDDDDELDTQKERLHIINELKRQSSTPFENLDDFEFKGLENESKPYFTAINKLTNEQILIEKSDAVQKKQNSSKRKSKLSKSSTEANRLKQQTNISPPTNRSGIKRVWNAYKQN